MKDGIAQPIDIALSWPWPLMAPTPESPQGCLPDKGSPPSPELPMRHFNVGGPCDLEFHYMLPAAERLPEVEGLVEQRAWFVVHAPRQTGKTTSLRAIAKKLTAEGRYAALHFSCEAGRALGDDYEETQKAILSIIRREALAQLGAALSPPEPWPLVAPAGDLMAESLSAWARTCPLPLVLVFDEIDALWGKGLESILRQLRAGYPSRSGRFPGSVILCGMRDVRDYKIASGGKEPRAGSPSPFKVLVESMRVGDFTLDEIRALYAQHTEETGRVFSDLALTRVHELTAGQPWLVNAIAREIVEKIKPLEGETIGVEFVEQAKERLILARVTHLDSLAARLMEDRVRRVIVPLIEGSLPAADPYDDDYSYATDLGLIAQGNPVRIANPIYREVIVRVLAANAERAITLEPRSFVRPDGRLDTLTVLREFAAFWLEHGEILSQRMPYHEVAPQLILMAFLQRVVNGGGYVDREYGVGRGRIDLLLRWPHLDLEGRRQWQREALELKVWAAGRPDPLGRGMVQIDGYLASLGLEEGWLVLFDRRPDASPFEERIRFEQATTASGRRISVLRA